MTPVNLSAFSCKPRPAASRFSSTLGLTAGLIAIAVSARPAAATTGTLYSDLGAAPGYSSGGFYIVQGPTSSAGSIVEAAQFTPTSTGFVSEVDAAMQGFQNVSTINLSIVTDNGNVPSGTSLFSATTSINTAADVYRFNSAQGLLLTAGTSYWLVAAPITTEGANWFVNNSGATGLQGANFHNQGYSVSTAGLPAFQVSGTLTGAASAPEPAPLALLALSGLPLGIGLLRRRRAAAH